VQAVTNVALPFFAVVASGYLAARSGLLPRAAAAGINVFVFHFALPALLVASIAASPVREVLDPTLLLAWLLPSLLLFVLGFVLMRHAFRASRSEAAVQALAGVFSNVGFMGLPLVVVALGTAAILPAVLVVLADTVLMIAIATMLIESERNARAGVRSAIATVLGGVARNPVIVSALLGLLLAALQVSFPAPLAAYLELLGNAAAPAALFALGAALAARGRGRGAGSTAAVLVLKLLVHPLLVLWVALWLQLPPLWLAVLVIQASLPIAVNVYVLAQRYEVAVDQMSGAIFLSTLISIVTVSFVLSRFI
jgi:malonate transporter and related proteins